MHAWMHAKSRSQGKRARRSSRFHGCIASFRAVVTLSNRDPSQWVVKIVHEERCHNHRLTEALYVTLKRSKDLIDDSILEKLDAFVETNTNTKQITDYVATRLGLPITSQRIRNLINARLGSTDTEQRLKMLIDKFIAQDGNQCLLIQNEWDLTCGIVIQSIAQKAVYERWSENLVLDWTHSTNNLGFYLGSLIATVADGRGVSVLDFLCMNQQKETLKAVLSFFKSNNPNWAHLESLVIDKDFTEWSTLQEVFPNATVLLCQFHAIQYMRRMLGSQKYLVPVMRRTEIEKLFRGLMYASSVTVYQHRKRSFVSRVKAISPAFANYFDRNWFSCSSMWCNYGRRCCFSAGNTTTNRVESSWNQHKQLMGKKSSIDKCLSVVFQHQVSVLRQLSNSLELFEVQAPAGPSIPTALRRLHDALSFYCFQRVRRQWDYNVVKGDKWEWHHCTEKQHDVYRLVLSMGDHVKVVWSTERCYCDCLFYASTRLPCQHLFNVMATQRDMDMFEVAQLDPRWSMARARSVLPELSQSIHHLSDVRQLKSGGDRDSSEVKLDSKRRIRYVKLKRNERCDEVVLSDCEKYNVVRAEVQSLIDEMQKLPSHEFYPRFSDLRDVLSSFKEKWALDSSRLVDGYSSGDETAEGDDTVDVYSPLNLEDMLAEAETDDAWARIDGDRKLSAVDQNIDQELEEDVTPDLEKDFVDFPSQVSLPGLVISEASQELMGMTNVASASEIDQEVAQLYGSSDSDGPGSTAQDQRKSGLNSVRLPTPSLAKSYESKRKRTRLGIVECNNDCPINLEDFLWWVCNTPDLNRVIAVMEQYPVMLNQKFLLTRNPTSWMADCKSAQTVDPDENEAVPVAYLTSDVADLSIRYIELATHFYTAMNDVECYNVDLAWIRKDWSMHSDTGIAFLGKVKRAPSVLAEEVAQLYETSWLDRTFTSGSGEQTTCAAFRELFGRLTGVVRLSDVIMDSGLQRLCSYDPSCFAVKAVNVENKTFKIPDRSMRTFSHVIVPVYVRDLKHWLMQIVAIDIRDEPKSASRITVTMYDPLGLTSYMTNLEKKWDKFTLPMLRAWHERDCTREQKPECPNDVFTNGESNTANQTEGSGDVHSPKSQQCGPKPIDSSREPKCTQETALAQPTVVRSDPSAEHMSDDFMFPDIVKVHLLTPTQSDSVSCDLFCLSQAHSYISNNRDFETKKKIQAADLEVMRLRLIWEIVCNCDSVGRATYGDLDSVVRHVELDNQVNRVFVTNVKSQ